MRPYKARTRGSFAVVSIAVRRDRVGGAFLCQRAAFFGQGTRQRRETPSNHERFETGWVLVWYLLVGHMFPDPHIIAGGLGLRRLQRGRDYGYACLAFPNPTATVYHPSLSALRP